MMELITQQIYYTGFVLKWGNFAEGEGLHMETFSLKVGR